MADSKFYQGALCVTRQPKGGVEILGLHVIDAEYEDASGNSTITAFKTSRGALSVNITTTEAHTLRKELIECLRTPEGEQEKAVFRKAAKKAGLTLPKDWR
jgi:hypothetical protein